MPDPAEEEVERIENATRAWFAAGHALGPWNYAEFAEHVAAALSSPGLPLKPGEQQDDAVVERAARAIHEALEDPVAWENLSAGSKGVRRKQARAALSAMPTDKSSAYRLCVDGLVRAINNAVAVFELTGDAWRAQNARGDRDAALAFLEGADIGPHEAVLAIPTGANNKETGNG